MHMLRQVLTITLVATTGGTAARADVINVPADQPTIQAAIDVAISGQDEVVVADGTYTGPGNVDLNFNGKLITVRSGSDAPASCVIDCQNSGRGVLFENGETSPAVLRGFTITNGGIDDGAGVKILGAAPTIMNCRFILNHATDDGGAIFISGSGAPSIIDCDFIGNTAVDDGGAVRNITAGTVFTDCLFLDNAGAVGGAVINTNGGTPSFSACWFEGNYGAERGGAVSSDSSASLMFTECTFSGNSTTGVGGGLRANSSATTLIDCTFWGNIAGTEGGGLYSLVSDVTFSGGSFGSNFAPLGDAIINRAGRIIGGTNVDEDQELLNGGIVLPGLDPSPLTVAGSFRNEFTSASTFRIPTVEASLGGTDPGVGFGVLAAAQADLFGSLEVTLAEGFVPQVGDTFDIVTTDDLVEPFGVARLSAIPDGLRLTVDNSATGVSIGIAPEPVGMPFEDGGQVPFGGFIRDVAIADFDGDGLVDVLLLTKFNTGPGAVTIFRNQGVAATTGWGGLQEFSSFATTGTNPIGVAIGRFNLDDALDLAITDSGTNSIKVYHNTADGTAQFNLAQTLGAPGAMGAIDAGPVFGSGLDDIVTAFYYSNSVLVFRNDGSGTLAFDHVFDETGASTSVRLADFDGDTILDLLVSGRVIYMLNPATEEFEQQGGSAQLQGTAENPCIADWNNDGLPDVVTLNRIGDRLEIQLNHADGSGTLGLAGSRDVAPGPISVTAADAGADGDLDPVVVVRSLAGGQNYVWLLRNDADGSETMILNELTLLLAFGDARFVRTADLNGDGVDDLVVVDYGTGVAPEASVGSIRLFLGQASCPADLDGDGLVGIVDFLDLLSQWGTDPGGPPDLDGDGDVGITDFLELLASWGPCS